MSNWDIARALRDAAPYIVMHKGKTMVLVIPGHVLCSDTLPAFLDDITLLSQVAGIRFAIAFDVLPQAKGKDGSTLARGHVEVGVEQITNLRNAVNEVRGQMEMILGSGTPGLGGIGTVAGEPMPARKLGVVAGKDLGLMGIPKPLSQNDADSLIDSGRIVLLPPLGLGVGGKILHLDSRNVALAFAIASKSEKLVVFVDVDEAASLEFREMTTAEAKKKLDAGDFDAKAGSLVSLGLEATARGVGRVHFIDSKIEGGLLLELLSADGVAAMLSKDPFDAVRVANPSDINAIADLIAPATASGALAPRTVQDIAETIDSFAVVARDDVLIACASLSVEGDSAEFGCLAVRPDYANLAYGQLLLDYFEKKARHAGVKKLLVVTTQASDWFLERGFSPVEPNTLPRQRQQAVLARSALVLAKPVS